jgi:hypothetical protein
MQCDHCKEEVSRPINVTIRDRDHDGEVHFENEVFCCWECAAIWFNARAGEILMPDLDHEHCQDVKW